MVFFIVSIIAKSWDFKKKIYGGKVKNIMAVESFIY